MQVVKSFSFVLLKPLLFPPAEQLKIGTNRKNIIFGMSGGESTFGCDKLNSMTQLPSEGHKQMALKTWRTSNKKQTNLVESSLKGF